MVGKTTREHPKTEEEQLSEVAKAAFDWQGTCYDAFTKEKPLEKTEISYVTEYLQKLSELLREEKLNEMIECPIM